MVPTPTRPPFHVDGDGIVSNFETIVEDILNGYFDSQFEDVAIQETARRQIIEEISLLREKELQHPEVEVGLLSEFYEHVADESTSSYRLGFWPSDDGFELVAGKRPPNTKTTTIRFREDSIYGWELESQRREILYVLEQILHQPADVMGTRRTSGIDFYFDFERDSIHVQVVSVENGELQPAEDWDKIVSQLKSE